MQRSFVRSVLLSGALLILGAVGRVLPAARAEAPANDLLSAGFETPPDSAKLRAYWWWLNGNVTRESITRDLEQMKAKGFGGAILCDAGGADQFNNGPVPHGPTFFSPEWRALYRHTLHEADRLGLELSLNILSGWNVGGPTTPAADAVKQLVWSETSARGPSTFSAALPEPKHAADPFYRDVVVIAFPTPAPGRPAHAPIQHLAEKAMIEALHFSAPDTTLLLQDVAPQPGEEDASAAQVVELTAKLAADGTLRWDVPAGEWTILRFGYTIPRRGKVSTSSDGWKGYALDVLDRAAFRRYWDELVEPLIADAGPLTGRTLKYLHTDSWEIEGYTWTANFRAEFAQRRGYDPVPFLPVFAGRIVESRPASNRFLNDFRKTLGDLAVDNHYRPFAEWAHQHGLEIHPESGGPHAVPIDAQRCLGQDDAPMSEFWAWSWTHRIGDQNRFFVKQPASAAHTYGKPLVVAEGFTSIGPHWQETLWDNLKPAFDHATCEGMNRLVWHAFVCSPAAMGIPGQQYFAGTHLNPNVTWWDKSAPFFTYLNRVQFMMQQGRFVADACYYYGDHVPNFARLRSSDPAHIGPGYDYDVITEEALLTRLSAKDGNLVLPDGMSYRVLVLPNETSISPPVLRKVKELVEAGATVIGPAPQESSTWQDHAAADAEVTTLAAALWNADPARSRVIADRTAREVLLAHGVKPDFEYTGGGKDTAIDYIHRRIDHTEIYFVANRGKAPESIQAVFRVSGLAPELWDPVSGVRRFADAYAGADGRTTMPLDFSPCGSWLVVFREPAAAHPATARSNSAVYEPRQTLAGSWDVHFDPRWGGPDHARFEQLVSWTMRPEPGIRFYSGTACYRQVFDVVPALAGKPLLLDLGAIRELASVRLNGENLGIVWAPPFRVALKNTLKPRGNVLEIEVVNFWPNRIIGDQSLPEDRRLTRTNIRQLTATTPLIDSGLFGPVQLLEEIPPAAMAR